MAPCSGAKFDNNDTYTVPNYNIKIPPTSTRGSTDGPKSYTKVVQVTTASQLNTFQLGFHVSQKPTSNDEHRQNLSVIPPTIMVPFSKRLVAGPMPVLPAPEESLEGVVGERRNMLAMK